ncbi:MAG TPA: isocitrate lyase/phosphoenolpyruvate mutase family protein, partial [Pirellulaceae bacterium]|nr:isocitrate lyase/phosphoenolpyruvate mutase family protein [Pirellulaceae bacterium]
MPASPRRLRRLLARPGIIKSLAPHDVLTARVCAAAGVELLFLGGFGVSASSYGLPDIGLTTLTEMTEAVRRMTDRVDTPLIADGDTGHGDLQNVARTVRDFERAGAAGILLEDQVAPKRCGHFAGKQVIPADAMCDKLKAALDARHDPDFVILARTDSRAIEGLDAALARAARYAETGVDAGFIEAPQSVAELERVARETTLPQLANMLPGGATPLLSIDELAALGFKIAVDPVSSLAITARAVDRLARAWLDTGRVDSLTDEMLSFGELKRLVGLDEFFKATQPGGPVESLDAPSEPWRSRRFVEHSQVLLDSFRRWLGRDLVDRSGTPLEQARRLFEADCVVVSHGTQADPILNYANRTALDLWEFDLATILMTPSRLTAEMPERDERSRLLERTRRDGYVDDYRGV